MDWTPTISGRSGPVYQRLVDALADDITGGRLHQGRRLPTHRALAQSLGIDVTTVTRAYAEAQRLGLVEARVGRGTFVKIGAATARGANAPPAIDLSMNLPPLPEGDSLDAKLFATLAEIRRHSGFTPYLSYQQTGGSLAERGIAAEWLRPRVPGVTGERVLIAPGTQATLMALLLALTSPGDVVLAEPLTYPGLKAAASAARVRLTGVDMDSEGVRPEALEAACSRQGARLIVLTPTMHNPTTATMSAARRAHVAEILRAHAMTLIEDDPYLFLDGGAVPLAADLRERTYLAASLSKCVAPGLRTSLLVAPSREAAERIAGALRATVQMAAPLMTAVAVRWLQTGIADGIIASVREEAASRQALARTRLPNIVAAGHPASPHIWLPAPDGWSSDRFAALLGRRGLGVVASEAFAVAPEPPPCVRVALGAARTRAELHQGLTILHEALAAPAPEPTIV